MDDGARKPMTGATGTDGDATVHIGSRVDAESEPEGTVVDGAPSAEPSTGQRPGGREPLARDLVGSKVGNFRLDALIAVGGMGAVYEAFDEVLERPVAIKSVHHGQRLDPGTRARFLREARLLSRLQHRHICQVHDFLQVAGTDYLVLELIRGSSLREAVARGMTMGERLEVAAQLLDALIAAHDQGVVHRDLKPDNVMLSEEGEVKVLDFGIARIAGAGPAEAERGAETSPEEPPPGEFRTRLGAVIGTLEYMSPEQAAGEPATPASDIYSCGLVLQELFTGARPCQPGLTATELLARALEGDTRPVSGLDPDLSALVVRMKATAPGARPSARDAAERLAWIRDLPRRRTRRLLAGLGVAALAFTAALTSYQAWRIGEEAERANAAAARASAEARTAALVSEFLEGLFRVSDPGEARGNTVTAREILDRGSERIRSELEDQPEVRSRLLLTMGRVYRELGLYADAETLLGEALVTSQRDTESDDLRLAEVLVHIGRLRELQGRFDEGVEVLEQAIAAREAHLPPSDPLIADAVHRLANLHYQLGRYDTAITGYQRALTIIRQQEHDDVLELVRPLHNLANVYQRQQRYDEAIPLYEESLRLMEGTLGADHHMVGHPLNNLGMVYIRQGRPAAAIPLLERARSVWTANLGADHPLTLHPMTNLADAQRELGRTEEALTLGLEVLAARERVLGPDHPDVALSLHGLALTQMARGRPEEALPLFDRALVIRRRTLEADHPDLVGLHADRDAALRASEGAAAEPQPAVGRP